VRVCSRNFVVCVLMSLFLTFACAQLRCGDTLTCVVSEQLDLAVVQCLFLIFRCESVLPRVIHFHVLLVRCSRQGTCCIAVPGYHFVKLMNVGNNFLSVLSMLLAYTCLGLRQVHSRVGCWQHVWGRGKCTARTFLLVQRTCGVLSFVHDHWEKASHVIPRDGAVLAIQSSATCSRPPDGVAGTQRLQLHRWLSIFETWCFEIVQRAELCSIPVWAR
jgi:hypothetical protein